MKKGWLRLSRGTRTVLNMALASLVFVLIWGLRGYPLPTKEMEFRRMERTYLLPRSEIVFQTASPNQIFPLTNGPELRFSVRFFVGLREDRVTLCAMEQYRNGQWDRSIVSLTREDGTELIPLLREGKYLEPVGWYPERISENTITTRSFLVLLLLNAPEETARAEVTVRGDGEEFSGGGWRLKDGNWLLGLESDLVGRGAIPYQNASYTLELFASDGSLLLERSGSFEEKRA